jgi:hypothetical protein
LKQLGDELRECPACDNKVRTEATACGRNRPHFFLNAILGTSALLIIALRALRFLKCHSDTDKGWRLGGEVVAGFFSLDAIEPFLIGVPTQSDPSSDDSTFREKDFSSSWQVTLIAYDLVPAVEMHMRVQAQQRRLRDVGVGFCYILA